MIFIILIIIIIIYLVSSRNKKIIRIGGNFHNNIHNDMNFNICVIHLPFRDNDIRGSLTKKRFIDFIQKNWKIEEKPPITKLYIDMLSPPEFTPENEKPKFSYHKSINKFISCLRHPFDTKFSYNIFSRINLYKILKQNNALDVMPETEIYEPKTSHDLSSLKIASPWIIKRDFSGLQTKVEIISDKSELYKFSQEYSNLGFIIQKFIENVLLYKFDDKFYKFHLRVNLLIYETAGLVKCFIMDFMTILFGYTYYIEGDLSYERNITGKNRVPIANFSFESLQLEDHQIRIVYGNILKSHKKLIESFDNKFISTKNNITNETVKNIKTYLPFKASNFNMTGAFEIYGSDVVIEKDLNVKILEVNDRNGFVNIRKNEKNDAEEFSQIATTQLAENIHNTIIAPHFGLKPVTPTTKYKMDKLCVMYGENKNGALYNHVDCLKYIELMNLNNKPKYSLSIMINGKNEGEIFCENDGKIIIKCEKIKKEEKSAIIALFTNIQLARAWPKKPYLYITENLFDYYVQDGEKYVIDIKRFYKFK